MQSYSLCEKGERESERKRNRKKIFIQFQLNLAHTLKSS